MPRVNSPELYDPLTGVWSSTGEMLSPRSDHFAVCLANGKVLVGGGFSTSTVNTAELHDPDTGTWNATGAMNDGALDPDRDPAPGRQGAGGRRRASHESLRGTEDGRTLRPGERHVDLTGAMNISRNLHTATLLADGRVLVAGGMDQLEGGATRSSAEIYDPATGSWTLTGSLRRPRAFHTANLLPGGKVLVTGGGILSPNKLSYFIQAEVYDPATGEWTETGFPRTARVSHSATVVTGWPCSGGWGIQ